MKKRRNAATDSWWRSHYAEKCRCPGCSGQETDLAVFQTDAMRFAVHSEIKRPGDRFPRDKDQARNYALRAECWARNPPRAILPHQEATTMLAFAKAQREEFAPHIEKFGRH
ncbi:MAG: hypothetical protein OXH76_10745 [Boseongicola sp.]|nr:hypothetical protein [Boseongicola sp.]